MKPEFSKSALLIVDMQNDFINSGGYLSRLVKRRKFADFWESYQPLVKQAIPNIRRLAQATRAAGRPVVHIHEVLREDYSDACRSPNCIEEKLVVEGTWGAQIIDELKPEPGEMVITKKGNGAFTYTPLSVYLRNLGITTCIMTGVGTSVCVAATIIQGVDLNYSMVLVSDGTADDRQSYEGFLRVMDRFFGDVRTTDEVISALQNPSTKGASGQ